MRIRQGQARYIHTALFTAVNTLCIHFGNRLGRDVTSEEVGLATLEELRAVDDVAYVRFASVYKGFEEADDFAREIRMLVKTTAPKSRG